MFFLCAKLRIISDVAIIFRMENADFRNIYVILQLKLKISQELIS